MKNASKMNTDLKKSNIISENVREDEICRRVNCIFCPCQFVSTNELRKHVLAHVNNKPFACDICNKKFTIKQALMRHKKKHDSGVSSEEENSEEDLPHYRACASLGLNTINPVIKPLVSPISDDINGASAEVKTPDNGSKRANLMDTINKLSAVRSQTSTDKKSTLDQLFGNPSFAQS